MELVIKTLNNAMSGVDFRSIINTNFQNIKDVIDDLNDNGGSSNTVIYTETEITETDNYKEGTIQVICNDTGIEVKQLTDGSWESLCKYSTGKSGLTVISTDESGIGYPITEINEALEGLPVGYVEGVKTVAGVIAVDGEDPVHCVGWYKLGNLLKSGRIKLDSKETAGKPVYVLNDASGGLNEFDKAINKKGSTLTFENNSDIPWTVNSDYGGVKSGKISGNGKTTITTKISVAGHFKYDYKISSEGSYDFMKVYKNDSLAYSYSGTGESTDITIDVEVGDIIKFEYTKDGGGDSGDDAGYIKNVAVYDDNGLIISKGTTSTSKGWTLDIPVVTGQLIQVIGFISDDGNYIDIDIQPWCIVS